MLGFSNKRIKEYFENLHNALGVSFLHIKDDIMQVNSWIHGILNKQEDHEQKISDLQYKIDYIMRRLVEQRDTEDKIVEKPAIEHVQSFNRSVQSFMNVQDIRDISKLTPAQRQVILLLLSSGGPMGYEDIAKKLNLNLVTVRRHVNDILRSGVELKQQVSVKNRRKMFFIDDKMRNYILKVNKGSKKRLK